MHASADLDGEPSTGFFDVVYVNERRQPLVLAENLVADEARKLAKAEATRRHVGRMFSAGSAPHAQVVLIVPAGSATAGPEKGL